MSRQSPDPNGILPDANVWIAALETSDRTVRPAFERVRESDLVRLISPVRFEILRGIRSQHRFDYIRGYFRAVSTIPLLEVDWDHAATLARRIAGTGGKHKVQMTDLLLAAVASRTGSVVWSREPDLTERIAPHAPGLGLFEP